MADLDPVAFDIETTGLSEGSVLSAVGFAHDLGAVLILNTDGRDADHRSLVRELERHATGGVQLELAESEQALLTAMTTFVENRLDGDTHYVTAFNGETYRGGFDLPFCRTRYLEHDMDWPFGDIAYADMMQIVDRFDTGDYADLVGVYDTLVGNETCDPFEDSAEAVDAFEAGSGSRC